MKLRASRTIRLSELFLELLPIFPPISQVDEVNRRPLKIMLLVTLELEGIAATAVNFLKHSSRLLTLAVRASNSAELLETNV